MAAAVQRIAIWVIFDRGSGLGRPATSASPRKLTSGANEKLVARNQYQSR